MSVRTLGNLRAKGRRERRAQAIRADFYVKTTVTIVFERNRARRGRGARLGAHSDSACSSAPKHSAWRGVIVWPGLFAKKRMSVRTFLSVWMWHR